MSDAPRRDEAPRPDPAQGEAPPNPVPAPKDEVATDVAEVARQRLEGTDKTQTAGSIAEDAADAAPGVAGTPADDDTAAKVEAAPSATAPTAASTDGGSKTAPAETQPAGTGAPTQPSATQAAPAAESATRAATSSPPPSSGGSVADPDNTATAPTAPDAPATAAGAAAASSEAEKKPAAPANTAGPAGAAGEAAKPAPAARPTGARPAGAAGAAGARPGAAGGRPAAAATPPKPPEPDPDEVTSLRELAPDLTWERRHGYLEVKVPKDQLIPIARKVKGLGYDYLSAVTAVDWRDRVEMLYHCYGWDYVSTPGCVVIRADLPPEPNPVCPSLTTVWAGAELQEREVYDLFGVKFVGHPDLRRILLEDRFPGHPLRKDWTFDYEYVLVRHLKYGAEGQDAPPGGEEGFRRV
jgi:NADH-quinone oxidoreductase subunit C